MSALFVASPVAAADLPPHGPLRILIVSDSVNPNMLSDAELTQAGDLGPALAGPNTGLNLAPGDDSVLEVSSQCVDDALAALADPTDYTTFLYFAHRSARGCDDSPKQVELTAAVEALLVAGGGVVVFHHGIYQDAGKEAILQLVGGTAGSIQWDTQAGQNVLNVADGHFVTSNGVEYTDMIPYADMQAGVPMGNYPAFTNVPDERYPALNMLALPGEARTVLFASDYNNNGGTHVLGWDLQRPGWLGRVVFYQPGEWQPHALDDVDGNNFQILANAIVHASPAGEDPGGTSTGDPGTGSEGSEGGPAGTDAGETTNSPGETTNSPGETTNSPGETGGPTGVTTSGEPTGNGETLNGEVGDVPGSSDEGAGETPATGTATDGQESGGGCGCRSSGSPAGLAVLALAWRRRRPRGPARTHGRA